MPYTPLPNAIVYQSDRPLSLPVHREEGCGGAPALDPLVLHALHHPDEPETKRSSAVIRSVIAIVEWVRTHLKRVHKIIGQPATKPGHAGMLSRLHGILIRQGREWISRSDLHQAFDGNIKGKVLATALAQLEVDGVAEQGAVPTEGRPRVERRW